jgi:ribosome-associated protein
MTALEKAVDIARILEEKKAQDVKVLHIGNLTAIGDYFVVATGLSNIQVRALADEIDKKLSERGEAPKRIEGYRTASWVLLDYRDVIVHIFMAQTREQYALERLWSDAPTVPFE